MGIIHKNLISAEQKLLSSFLDEYVEVLDERSHAALESIHELKKTFVDVYQSPDPGNPFNVDAADRLIQLAALLIFRWVDTVDREHEAEALFNNESYDRVLPVDLRWDTWSLFDLDDKYAALEDLHRVQADWIPCDLTGLKYVLSPKWRFQDQLDYFLDEQSKSMISVGHDGGLQNLILAVRRLRLATHTERSLVSEALTQLASFVHHASPKSFGPLFTSPELARVMARLASPEPGERVFDPCFGSGSLIVECVRQLRLKGFPASSYPGTSSYGRHVTGIEIESGTYLLGLARVLLSGLQPRFTCGNAFLTPIDEGSFDLVIAALPFGLKTGPEGKIGEAEFLDLCLESLRPGGRAVIAISPGFLFRRGKDGKTREKILEDHTLEAVINIPPKAFSFKGTSIGAAVLVITKGGPTKEVHFINRDTLNPVNTVGELQDESFLSDLNVGLRSYEESLIDFQDIFASNAQTLSRDEIKERGNVLIPPSPIEATFQEIANDLKKLEGTRLFALGKICSISRGMNYKKSLTTEVGFSGWLKINESLEFVFAKGRHEGIKLSEVVQDNPEYIQWLLKDHSIEPNFIFILENTLKDVDPFDGVDIGRGLVRVGDVKHGKITYPPLSAGQELAASAKDHQILRSDDLVYTISGSVGRVARATGKAIPGCIATNGLAILRINENEEIGPVSPKYLAALLQSATIQQVLEGQSRGAVIQHLPLAVLRSLKVPIPRLQIQERVSKIVGTRGRHDALQVLQSILTEDKNPVVRFLLNDPSLSALRELRNLWLHTHNQVGGGPGDRTADSGLEALRGFGTGLSKAIKALEPSQRDRVKGDSEAVLTWLNSLEPIALALAGRATIEKESGFLPQEQISTLALTEANLGDVIQSIPLELQGMGVKRKLEHVVTVIHFTRNTLVENVSIDAFQIGYAVAAPGDPFLTLQVVNSGLAPIVNFWATLELGSQTLLDIESDFLSGAGTIERPVFQKDLEEAHRMLWEEMDIKRGLVPIEEDPRSDDFRTTLHWGGRTLDMSLVGGEVDVLLTLDHDLLVATLDLENLRPGKHSLELGENPYITGNPVKGDELFGRDDILDQIRARISTKGTANIIVLEGNRRTGKTSILRQLELRGTLPEHIPVVCDLQEIAGEPLRDGVAGNQFFSGFGKDIIDSCLKNGYLLPIPESGDIYKRQDIRDVCEKINKGVSLDREEKLLRQETKAALKASLVKWCKEIGSFEALCDLVDIAIEEVAPKRLLLMLDEYDKLYEGLESGVTSTEVPAQIRHLFQANTKMDGILSGATTIRRLSQDYWSALFGFGSLTIQVSVLPQDAARDLIQKPAEEQLRYQDDALEEIVRVTACHPYHIQQVCSQIHQQATKEKVTLISKSHAENGIRQAANSNRHFQTVWNSHIGREGKTPQYVAFLCHRFSKGDRPVTFELLEHELEKERVSDREINRLGDYLDQLIELEVLSKANEAGSHVYKLTIPLQGLWMDHAVDPQRLTNEVREKEDV